MSHDDRRLILAYEDYDRRNHHTCGQPIEDAFHPEMDGGYELSVHTCFACKRLESLTREDGTKVTLQPGQTASVYPTYDWRTGENINSDDDED